MGGGRSSRRQVVAVEVWVVSDEWWLNADDRLIMRNVDAIWFVYSLLDERAFWTAAVENFERVARARAGRTTPVLLFVGTHRDRVRVRVFDAGAAPVRRVDAERMAGVYRAGAHMCVAARHDPTSVHRVLLRTLELMATASSSISR